MHLVEAYLRDLWEIRQTGAGVPETSYYAPLSNLLNEVGRKLKPHVRCVMPLSDTGAGFPDGGLFTANQFDKKSTHLIAGQPPACGAIEVKPAKDNAWVTAETKQVSRYWQKYRQVLVTNYRDFVLVGQDRQGHPVKLEPFRLADGEREFWKAAATPHAAAERLGDRLVEYLERVMRHASPLAAPEDVAWFLASYAHEAKARMEEVKLHALATVRQALEEALGMKFEGERGEHFFRSSLVQTLFYGIFSAWVLWSKRNPPNSGKRFDWRLSIWSLNVPMIGRLFSLIADPAQLESLGLTEVLDWAEQVLNRVERGAFFDRFEESHAVQYFYEPFLEAFDPELRKQLGVWYTPPEIVKYMVERVDTVLRQELNLPLGLADPNVYVLDPCCGTGSYLVEVLDRIHRTLAERGEDALTVADLKAAALNRVFGFEILPAPFVVAHLQLGLLLQRLGVPLSEKRHERAAVYLTNALTGWEPPKGPKQHLIFPELEAERDAAERVKQVVPILVILGNPPYNAFAGVSPVEEQGLVEPYKKGLISEWGIKKFNLDDLYVRFFRLAERRIAEKTGRGVVSFISNHSWVSDPSFVVLRKHLLDSFDRFWIENMHGNRKISEYAPDGRTSETIFAIPGFSVGIQQGVAISLWVKSGRRGGERGVLFREDLNKARAAERRAQLLESLTEERPDSRYTTALPAKENRYSFRPSTVSKTYLNWPTVSGLSQFLPTLGILENRRDALISVDRAPLEERIRTYYNREIDWEALRREQGPLTEDMARFDARQARGKALAAEPFRTQSIRRLMVRPMDHRWCYYTSLRPIWNEPRPAYVEQCWPGNSALVTRRRGVAVPEGVPFFYTPSIGAQHGLNTDAYYVPVRLREATKELSGGRQSSFATDAAPPQANLSVAARSYLTGLGIENPDDDAETAGLIWMHALAIGYSPAYLTENADGIRQDWPRIPLPDSKELLEASAALGERIALLLDPETPLEEALTRGAGPKIDMALLKDIAVPARVGGGALKEGGEEGKEELAVTAGWGHAGKGGVTMPGKGRLLERELTAAERAADPDGLLGGRTCDVYLNEAAYWKNIPLRVWKYTIGGYQVIKKWLSYRERPLLGRPLSREEVRYVRDVARRLAAILLLEPTLDANYRVIKEHSFPWKQSELRADKYLG